MICQIYDVKIKRQRAVTNCDYFIFIHYCPVRTSGLKSFNQLFVVTPDLSLGLLNVNNTVGFSPEIKNFFRTIAIFIYV